MGVAYGWLDWHTRWIVRASSWGVHGFRSMAATPRAAARSGSRSSCEPLHRMTGRSGRSRWSSRASVMPVMPGMVESVMTKSNRVGVARNVSRATRLSVQPTASYPKRFSCVQPSCTSMASSSIIRAQPCSWRRGTGAGVVGAGVLSRWGR